jgi:hypothetical protein
MEITAGYRGTALARRRKPIGWQRRAGQHLVERLAEFRPSPFVSG